MTEVISIHSFRGGTGKSNLTANLATTIALQGYRVGVVDTDIQSPGIHLIFGLQDEDINYSLNDFLWGNCSIEKASYDRTPESVAANKGKVFVVPSSLDAAKIARILRQGYDVGLLNEGFRTISQKLKLDYLLIDTHPGLNEETLLSMAISEALVIILRPDTQDYLGTAVTVEVARKLDVPKMLMVVNKIPEFFEVNNVKEQVEKNYQTPVAGLFILAEEMLELASNGVFCVKYPDHPFSEQLLAVAKVLIN